MNFKDLCYKNRSYRRFNESTEIDKSTLLDLIDCARVSASASNLQPLRYVISYKKESNDKIFPLTKWAGYLSDWSGPEEGERPTAYIIILGDTTINKNIRWDDGIAAQTILLAAAEKGYGGCMIGSLDRDGIKKLLDIDDALSVLLIVALGEPIEKVKIKNLSIDGSVKYWRDENGVHHVPKRLLDDVVTELHTNQER